MAIRTLKWLRQGSVFLAALALTLGTGAVQAPAASAQGAPVDGIVCITGAAAILTFNLSTTTGYVGTPDDNVVFMWGYTVQGSAFQHPSPVLCVNQGDEVTINLVNTLPEAVSIVFPGQEDVLANGVPSQPQFSGSTMTSLAPVAAANGGTMSYRTRIRTPSFAHLQQIPAVIRGSMVADLIAYLGSIDFVMADVDR